MRFFRAFGFVIVAVQAGCGSADPTPIGLPTSHGGTLIGLPDGLGKVEAVREDLADKPDQVRLVLYFLDPEGKPLATAPTSATLKPQGRGLASINFKPPEGPGSAAERALASAPFRAGGEVSGELSVMIGGKAIIIPISVR